MSVLLVTSGHGDDVFLIVSVHHQLEPSTASGSTHHDDDRTIRLRYYGLTVCERLQDLGARDAALLHPLHGVDAQEQHPPQASSGRLSAPRSA